MRAVLIATGDCPELTVLNERFPAPLLPLVDRPFIQHAVEFLIDQGVLEIDFVLSLMPEKIELLLGDGTRWGSAFRYHLAKDASQAYRLLKVILPGEGAGPLLFGHADRLPLIQFRQNRPPADTGETVVYCSADPSIAHAEGRPAPYRIGTGPAWTGWAWLSSRFIADLPDTLDEKGLGARLLSAGSSVVEVPKPLSVRSYEEILASHQRVLSKEVSGLVLSGREIDQGIWLSRNVSLHPTAILNAPVYVSENCRIGAGVQLGPNAAVGKNCVLDSRCIVANSVIFPGSYVGEMVEIKDAIADKNCLVNVRLGATVTVTEDFILGSMSERMVGRWLGGILARLMAIVLLALTWPILLATALWLKLRRGGPVLHKKECVRLPTSLEEREWRTFELWSFCVAPKPQEKAGGRLRDVLLRFLPGLVNVAKGEMRFVGVSPRDKEEIRQLPSDWRALYLRAKAGIVTEAVVVYGDKPTEDELYSAEAFYSASAGIGHDLKLLAAYLAHIFKGLGKRD